MIVDVCPGHGTWFDPGEIQQLVALLRGGATLAPPAYEPRLSPNGWGASLPSSAASSEGPGLSDALDLVNALDFLWDVGSVVWDVLISILD